MFSITSPPDTLRIATASPIHVHSIGTSNMAPTKQTKQGGYGKVRIHRAPLAASLDEAMALATFAFGCGFAGRAAPLRGATADYMLCEDMLSKVSRSFAAVILHLPDHLRKAVCIFYLVLRVSIICRRHQVGSVQMSRVIINLF